MHLPKHFISCDWGTTNFRIKVVETETLEVLFEHKNPEGIRPLYEQYTQQTVVSQHHFFANFLKTQVDFLPVGYQSCPIVLSGMASSSIGLEELDYADFPFNQSGEDLLCREMTLHNGLVVFLVSGVKSTTGMMRGEETQAVGLADHLAPHGTGILILPGTHSKHIQYDQGSFTSLTNFMTGELFDVLSKKSILANSVVEGPWTPIAETVFKEGLALGFEDQLSASLLLVRANHVIQHSAKEDNYYLLSGMLVGDELSSLKSYKDKIFLAAPKPIFSIYKLGLETFFDPQQLVFFDDKVLDYALLLGQRKILAYDGK